jgi:LemA protein
MTWGILGLIGIVGVFLLFVVLLAVGVYNRLITYRNRFRNAFSQIDVQLKRRYDLIPNLVETAKGYLGHERETLESVVKARNLALTASQALAANPGNPGAMAGLVSAETQLGGALGRLFAVAEAYPDLKANQNMIALQNELTTTENHIAFARQTYNDSVMMYNTYRESFPNILFANAFAFPEATLFELAIEKEREAPRVSF